MRNKIVILFIILMSVNHGKSNDYTPLGDFSKIDIFGRVEVRLVKSDTNKIQIKPGNFDVSKVSFEIEDNELKIKLLKEFASSIKVNIEVFYDEIEKITMGGGAKLYNRGTLESRNLEIFSKSGSTVDLLVHADTVNAKLKRGAFLRLTGKGDYVKLKTTTGSDYVAVDFKNNTTEATLNGGTAEVNTTDFIDVTVRFGASLRYKSQPEKIKKKEQLGGETGPLESF